MNKKELETLLRAKERDLKFYRELVSYILTTFLTEADLEKVRDHMAGDKLQKIIYKK